METMLKKFPKIIMPMVQLNPPPPPPPLALLINNSFCEGTGISDSGKCDLQRLSKKEVQVRYGPKHWQK
jgi:hypothetical protein